MKQQRGFALLAALWLLTALSVASLAMAGAARLRRLAATNHAESIRARAAAAAGIEYARARLADRLASERRSDPWSGIDSLGTDTIALGDVAVTVAVQDVGARLNLNQAGENELRRLLLALRIDAGEADRLAQTIADWRDPDDLHRARGAERDDYLAAGAVSLPRNGPFQTVSELAGVRGMTRAVLDSLTPYLTLLGDGQINLNAAPAPVLLSLPGINSEAAVALLRLRQQGRVLGAITELERYLPPTARPALTARLADLMTRAVTETREVAIMSEATLPGSPVRARMTGLVVRARDAVFYVWSRVE